jgi:hypothetical protein
MRRMLVISSLFTIALPYVLIPSPALSSGLPKTICPQTVESLAQLLVRDLPGYANRATIKGRSRSQSKELTHIVLASQPEVEPLEIPNAKPNADLHQVFITTLERQTLGDRMYEFQQYHWLFLAKTRVGWRLTQSFSRTGRYPPDDQITATRDSSQGAIAQGIKIWLRDCNAGSLRL